jgi:S1-C subfamily serine protease
VIEFDGERVRSAQQFSRLVQETPPGRQVRAAVLRDGKRTELSVTPQGGSGREIRIDSDRIQAQIDRVFESMPRITIDGQRLGMTGRIGARVQELTPELAEYFGAKDGVLVASVDADSPASRAGLRAGDVITAVNREPVTSASDLQRAVRSADPAQDLAVTIVRDKKESSVTMRVEPPARQRLDRPARPLRPVRGAGA